MDARARGVGYGVGNRPKIEFGHPLESTVSRIDPSLLEIAFRSGSVTTAMRIAGGQRPGRRRFVPRPPMRLAFSSGQTEVTERPVRSRLVRSSPERSQCYGDAGRLDPMRRIEMMPIGKRF